MMMIPEIDSVVVVPWDFSERARHALSYTINEVPLDLIRVLCVIEQPNMFSPEYASQTDAEENAKRKCTEQFEKEALSKNSPDLVFVPVFGDPTDEIIRFASQFSASMIIMASHHRSGIARLVLGSIAESVLRKATCPVLILPKATE